MERFSGIGVALVTPFDENFNIDKESLCRLVEHVIAGKVDFLVALGTTGESATLTREEKREVVNTVADVNRGRLPLMVGIGGYNTSEVLREIAEADWLTRCDGILSVTPYYNKPTQDGLFAHFRAIANAVSLPVCLYNVPSRTGVNITAQTVNRLAATCPNIIALKEASGNFEQATTLLRSKKCDFTLLSGDDSIVLPLISMGFDGVISVAGNLLPGEFANLVKSVKNGDYVQAREIHLRLADWYKVFFEEGNPAGVKAALCAAGIIRWNVLRLPLTPVSPELYARIDKLQLEACKYPQV